jgi:hypothetical protein
MVGEGSVGLEFSTLFTMFINNKLDKIISPKDILFHNSEEYVLNTLKGVIGKELYQELCTEIDAESVSTDNVTLIEDYIQPYLINKLVSECVIDTNYKIRNKALMVSSSDNAQPLDATGMTIIQQKYRNIAESYKNNLIEFLQDNRLTYPLFKCIENKTSIINVNLQNARPKKGRHL